MKAFKANEKFFCSICEEKYYTNQECIPICLKCGHTICKSCLNRMLKMRNNILMMQDLLFLLMLNYEEIFSFISLFILKNTYNIY